MILRVRNPHAIQTRIEESLSSLSSNESRSI